MAPRWANIGQPSPKMGPYSPKPFTPITSTCPARGPPGRVVAVSLPEAFSPLRRREGLRPLPPNTGGNPMSPKTLAFYSVFCCSQFFPFFVAEDGSTWANIGCKMGQHSPKMGQPSPKMGPRWANIAPRWANIGQHSPKMGPYSPKPFTTNHEPQTRNPKPQTTNHTQQPEQQQHRQPQQPQQLDPYHLNMGPWPAVARKRLNIENYIDLVFMCLSITIFILSMSGFSPVSFRRSSSASGPSSPSLSPAPFPS